VETALQVEAFVQFKIYDVFERETQKYGFLPQRIDVRLVFGSINDTAFGGKNTSFFSHTVGFPSK
jgi:hypothetical protein